MKSKLIVILLLFILTLFPVFSNTGNAAGTNSTSCNVQATITVVLEYHDGVWWLVGYNEYGDKVFEIEYTRE